MCYLATMLQDEACGHQGMPYIAEQRIHKLRLHGNTTPFGMHDGGVMRDLFLFAHVLRELSERKIGIVDLGSGPGGTNDPGLAQFKRGWGAVPKIYHAGFYRRRWYHVLRKIVR